MHARGAAQISAPSFPIRALRALKGQNVNDPAYREVLRKERGTPISPTETSE